MPWKRAHKRKHAAYMRKWRRSHPMTDEQRKKGSCRSYARQYLKRGKLAQEGCAVCGGVAQMHHPDYDRPLFVVWLCLKHHRDVHDWPVFLLMAREPNRRDYDRKSVDRERPKPPRVGRDDHDVRQDDRADDRDEKDETGREDSRDDIEGS